MIYYVAKKSASIAFLLLLASCALSLSAQGNHSVDARYVRMMYQRAIAVGSAVLELEKDLIFRLENNRPIEAEQAIARYYSAARQILQLRRLSSYFEKRLSEQDPALPSISALKSRFANIAQLHKKNLEMLKRLGNSELLGAAKSFIESCQELTPLESVVHPVRSIDDYF